MRYQLMVVLTLSCILSNYEVNAQIIDFEKRASNGTKPNDDDTLSNAYSLDGGGSVRLFFDTNENDTYDLDIDYFGEFEKVGTFQGEQQTGFLNFVAGTRDTAAPNFASQLGTYFFRQPNSYGTGVSTYPLIIKYDTTQMIAGLSGEIWDIDGESGNPEKTERWKVEVIDSSGDAIETRESPLGTHDNGPYDAKPWTFGFTGLESSDVSALRITFTGTKTSGLGLAFNNFSPTFSSRVISADYNLDGQINSLDLELWSSSYGESSAGDADGDGDTDGRDLLIWQRQVSPTVPTLISVHAVPEPGSLVLLGIGMIAASRRTGRFPI